MAPHPPRVRSAAWLPLWGLAASCVVVYEPMEPAGSAPLPPAVAVTVPFPDGGLHGTDEDAARRDYYGGVLRRLQDAVAERDPAQIESLVAGFLRADLPEWLRDRLIGYRATAKGLWFLDLARATARLECETLAAPLAGPEGPTIGTPLRFLFTLPGPGVPVVLGGRSDPDPTGFLVTLAIDDLFVDGTVKHQEMPEFLSLDQGLTLRPGSDLQLPIAIDLPPGGALRRTVVVRVELLPGHVQIDGVRAPLATTELVRQRCDLWPAGIGPIRREPLATLREALRRGDPEHFPHVVLAAACMPAEARAEAGALLIDVVRLGTPPQGRVATAALRELFAGGPRVGDRDGWLRFWAGTAVPPAVPQPAVPQPAATPSPVTPPAGGR